MQIPEQPQEVKQEEKPNPELDVVASIVILKLRNGTMQMEAKAKVENGPDVGDIHRPLSLREQRSLLEDCLTFVQDSIMGSFVASYIDKMLQEKIQPQGFRKKSVFDFLSGK